MASRTPIALVPNGVDLRPFEGLPARAELEGRHPELRGKFLLLFLGRLHAKKGLDLLSAAVAELARGAPELHVLLAGRDEGAGAGFLESLRGAGLRDRVTCLGHVAGEAAGRAWGAADAFVLPSYSEGFSMAVLEALAARRPVLITTACHFPDVATAGAGLVVEPTREGVTEGLRGLLALSARERVAMGQAGRRLVEARFTWPIQARTLDGVYRWVVGGGPAPDCVTRD
jgi:glycosyltransferase involved in cell wall biosynthesis